MKAKRSIWAAVVVMAWAGAARAETPDVIEQAAPGEANVDVATKTTEVTDESFANASVPGPDEEAIATGQAGARPFGEEEEEGGFDFEEAVFGSSDVPARRSE